MTPAREQHPLGAKLGCYDVMQMQYGASQRSWEVFNFLIRPGESREAQGKATKKALIAAEENFSAY